MSRTAWQRVSDIRKIDPSASRASMTYVTGLGGAHRHERHRGPGRGHAADADVRALGTRRHSVARHASTAAAHQGEAPERSARGALLDRLAAQVRALAPSGIILITPYLRDGAGMRACYHPDVEFSDPVFPSLKSAYISPHNVDASDRLASRVAIAPVHTDHTHSTTRFVPVRC